MSYLSVASKIPWGKIAPVADGAIRLADKLIEILLKKPKEAGKGDIAKDIDIISGRITDLEEYEKSQSELVKNIAERQDSLVVSLKIIDVRVKYCFIISLIGLILAGIALVVLLLR